MKFYDLVYSDYGYDLSYFSKYIIKGSVDKGLIIIKFDESEIQDIIKITLKSFKISNSDSVDFDSSFFFGADGFIYNYADGKLVKTKKSGCFRFIRMYCFCNARGRKIIKTHKITERRKTEFDESTVINKSSVLPLKAYEYYSKEQNIAFKYRFRKASSAHKPLVIFMAGGGCLGYDNIKPMYEYYTQLHRQLKNYDCNFLLPQSPNGSNTTKPTITEYIKAVKELCDRVCDDYSVDKNRIYLFGTSYGGWCTWNMVYLYPDYFACAIPVMGNFHSHLLKDDIEFERFKGTSFWVAHSSDDDNVPIKYDDYCVEQLKSIGADVKYTRWDKYGHKMCNKFYKNESWADWMFKQVKK